MTRARHRSVPHAPVLGLVLALVAAACPAPTDPGPGPTAAPPTPTGGSITIAYPTEPPTLDPFAPAGRAASTRDLVRLVMPSLLRDDGSPWLAAEPPVVRDGPPFSIEFAVHPDAVWSDGRAIGVEDLRATWRLARAQDLATPVYRWVTAIRDLGDGRVAVQFERRTERWRELFSAGLGVVPARMLDPAGRRRRLTDGWPVSGGPYVLRRWRPGLDMLFERNPRAWGSAVPQLDQIRVVFVPDPVGALRLFQRGEVEVLGPYHAADWTRRATEAGATVAQASGRGRAWLAWDQTRAPFRSGAVRAALRRGFDHRRIVDGLVAPEGVLAPGDELAEDVVGARARLEDAGWTGSGVRSRRGRELTFTVAMDEVEELGGIVVRAVKFQLERAGIRFEIVPVSGARLWREWIGGPEMESVFVLDRRARPGWAGIPLYRVVVGIGAGPGITLTAGGGPSGALATAHTWRTD